MDEHVKKLDQLMHKHLKNCSYFQEFGELHSLPFNSEIVDINLKENLMNAVSNNCHIIDQNNTRSQLRFLEAYSIKTLKSKIDDSLKASKELDLFK